VGVLVHISTAAFPAWSACAVVPCPATGLSLRSPQAARDLLPDRGPTAGWVTAGRRVWRMVSTLLAARTRAGGENILPARAGRQVRAPALNGVLLPGPPGGTRQLGMTDRAPPGFGLGRSERQPAVCSSVRVRSTRTES
jgi:hypothetical protein